MQRQLLLSIEKIIDRNIEAKSNVLLTKDDKLEMIDRINKAKMETIIWIVGIGVLQFVLSVLAKKFL